MSTCRYVHTLCNSLQIRTPTYHNLALISIGVRYVEENAIKVYERGVGMIRERREERGGDIMQDQHTQCSTRCGLPATVMSMLSGFELRERTYMKEEQTDKKL